MSDIIFICNANMCRSPIAEGILRHYLVIEHCPARVASMGIRAHEGNRATDFSVEIAAEHNIDISSHRSRPLLPDELLRSKMIFAMEAVQVDYIDLFFPQVSDRVYMLSTWPLRKHKKKSIQDPVGRSLDIYRKVFERIDEYIRGIVPHITTLYSTKQ